MSNSVGKIENKKNSSKSKHKRDWVVNFICISSIFTFNFALFLLIFESDEIEHHSVIYMLIGQMTSVYVMIYNYYFGNKHSNKAKNTKKNKR